METDELRLPGEPRSASTARNLTRRVLDSAGVPGSGAEDAALLVSELVTNAVVHAASPTITVRVDAGPPLRVEVEDANRSVPRVTPTPEHEPGGLGLRIVAEVASRWGTEQRERGKIVWFEIDVPAPRNGRP